MDVAHLPTKCFSSPVPSSSLPVLSRVPISLRRSRRVAWFRPIRLCSASGSDTLVAGSRKEDRRVFEAARKKLDESGGLKSWMHENGLLLLMGNETIETFRPANDDKMKATHCKLLERLRDASQAGDKSNASFALLIGEGLRFVLEQIQMLKQETSRARIRMIEPLIKGPASLEYLKKAFANRYGPPTDANTSLPLTMQWLSSIHSDAEQEWDEYMDSVASLTVNNERSHQGLPPTTLRTGDSISVASRLGSPSSTGNEQPECKGERVDLLVRVGLMQGNCPSLNEGFFVVEECS